MTCSRQLPPSHRGWRVQLPCFQREEQDAYAVVAMAAIRDLKLGPAKVNVTGGAVALGHPIGAPGSRITTTLVHALRRTGKRLGIAAICIGGGETTAVLVENPEA